MSKNISPWGTNGEGRFITDKKGYLLAQCTDKETAAHIVKCVNLHDELVAALERLAVTDEDKQLLERTKP